MLPQKKGAPEPSEEMSRARFVQLSPDFLRHFNRVVEIAKLPLHQRLAKMDEWDKATKKSKNSLFQALMPAVSKVQQADCRSQATLRSAVVALACERHRLKHKEWPKSLDVLVKEKLLDAIPLDPFDGQPLRYRKTKDRIVLYSVGPDLTDNQGAIDRERPQAPGTDIGFRLWNVEARRQPPLPPVVEDDR